MKIVTKVHIGCDHAGFETKEKIKQWLVERGHIVLDHGPASFDALDDYPPFCLATGGAVVAEPGSLGIVLGGSGNGEQIAANKVDGVRAALAWSRDTAALAREHNDANVLSIGARMHQIADVLEMIEVFLTTPFSGDDRHRRRIAMLTAYENGR